MRIPRITRVVAAPLAALTVAVSVVAVDRAPAQGGGARTNLYLEAESLLPAIESFATREVYSGAGEPKGSEGQAIARLQRNCCGVVWSGNAQVLFENTTKGNRFTLAFDVPRSRTYELRAVYTRGPDFGTWRMAVDRRPIGTAVNAYSPRVERSRQRRFGRLELARGRHLLTLTVTGKDRASSGLFAGLDYVVLRAR